MATLSVVHSYREADVAAPTTGNGCRRLFACLPPSVPKRDDEGIDTQSFSQLMSRYPHRSRTSFSFFSFQRSDMLLPADPSLSILLLLSLLLRHSFTCLP